MKLMYPVMMLTLVVFNSCDQDIPSQLESNGKSNIENPHAKYLANANLGYQVMPRGTKYSISNAIEYLNDGMNFLYCRPDEYYRETVIFKDTFNVPVASGEIDEDDLIELMDNIAEFAGSHFWGDGRLYKEPLMFNMRSFSMISPYTSVDIEAVFIMEAGSPLVTDDQYPYEDSWIFGQFGEDVSEECSEEGIDADAVDLFRRDLRRQLTYRNSSDYYYFKNPYLVCFSGHSNQCFAEEVSISALPNEDYSGYELVNEEDVTQFDNLFDYLIFVNHSAHSNFSECLDVSEMNYYYESMVEMVESVLPTPVGNSVIGQIEVGYEELWSTNRIIFHSLLVVKTTKVLVIEEEFEEAIPLPD